MFLVPLTRQANELSRSVDRLFDEGFLDRFFAPATSANRSDSVARSPALDVSESEKDYTIRLDMPGVTKDKVKVTIDGRRVSVEASVSATQEKKDGDRVVYTERSASSYLRSFTLPMEVVEAETQAKLEHGVLTLVCPKRGAASARQISVG